MTKELMSRYPIDFTTYDEFRTVYSSMRIPPLSLGDVRKWAEKLTKEQLRISNEHKFTVAHWLGWNKTFPECRITEDLLFLADEAGWTVAHSLAHSGQLPAETATDTILFLANGQGWTVAHELADNGFLLSRILFSDDGMSLRDNLHRCRSWTCGKTIADCLIEAILFHQKRWDLVIPQLLFIEYEERILTLYLAEKELAEMSEQDLKTAVLKMPSQTLDYMASRVSGKKMSGIMVRELERRCGQETMEINGEPFSDGDTCGELYETAYFPEWEKN